MLQWYKCGAAYVEYVLVRKKFFMKKVSKYHLLAERRDKSLIYNKI